MNRQWVLAARPVGAVRESDFRLVESPVPEPADGEFVVRTLYLSVAPVMRMYMLDGAGIEPPLAIGEVMRGRGVGRVVASRHADFCVGEVVQAKLGWQDYARLDGSPYCMCYKVAQRRVPYSTALGVLGITGFTSYLGLTAIGRVAAGETVLVSGAAGGVGSNCGWIARNLGCRVVGLAGTASKCRALVEEMGYDAAIDYRADDVPARIAALCPDGVDVYFDNVGGELLDHALARLNRYGRVVACGRISQYLVAPDDAYRLRNWHMLGKQRARLEGFFIYDLERQFPAAEQQMAEWLAAGTMRAREDVLQGLEQMPRALIGLYEGSNVGKQVVHVAD